MATSGAMSTDNQYIKYTISITQNSQSITGNTSNVTVKVRFYRTNTGYTTYGTGTVYCTINGTTYSASVTSSQKITSSGIVLFTKTLNISHNSDGTKTLTCSAKIDHQLVDSSYQSYSQTLTTIPRKSTLSVGNGTLGTAQTLTVTRQPSSFTHTITYSCGSASGTVASKSTSTSISFTPPLSLASQNTTGTSVSVKYTITTYNGSTSIGSNSYTKTCTIPASVKPTCSVTVSDATNYSSTYGGYLKGLSKFKVVVSGTTSYGSDISSYNTTVDGSTFTSSSFTTSVIKSAGSSTISSKVTDKRGRSDTKNVIVNVLNYNAPRITKLYINRCNSDGTKNEQGEYTKVTYSYTVSSLNNKNAVSSILQYKKSSLSTYTSITLESSSSDYTATNKTYVFKTDSGSSYDVTLRVSDNIKTSTRYTSVSTGFTLMHWKSNGRGMAIGKISEKDDTLEVGMKLWSAHGDVIRTPVHIASGQDLNLVTEPGYYLVPSITVSPTVVNKPSLSTTATAFLEVIPGGDGLRLIQRFTQCDKDDQYVWQRCYYQNTWGIWQMICGGVKKILFTPASGVDIVRYSISRQGDMVTMYANLSMNKDISSGTGTLFGSIPPECSPTNSVATTGVQGAIGTCVCWVRNTGMIYVRPGSAYTANSTIEFNLSWNITAEFATS